MKMNDCCLNCGEQLQPCDNCEKLRAELKVAREDKITLHEIIDSMQKDLTALRGARADLESFVKPPNCICDPQDWRNCVVDPVCGCFEEDTEHEGLCKKCQHELECHSIKEQVGKEREECADII